ncbi:hypothetical protein HOY80DRAFT_1115969 [Tuber brumale]|nr:hypothetical protein HOY80DRAFT_1115969 [Tuber brumale]
MQGLYDELWGTQLPVIKDHKFSIPHPGHGFRLGYKVDLKEIGDGTFPDSEFEKGKEDKVFKVLKVKTKLPCGRYRLLVRQEFETIERDLSQIESDKWTNTDPETGDPVEDLNLDYELGGQPGSGKSFFLSYLLVRRLLEGQPTAFRIDDNICYLFDSSSNGVKTDANCLFGLPEDRKKGLWILTDGVLTGARWNMMNHGWFVVLAASPAKVGASNQWKKDRNVASRYMSNWEWDEIIAAFILARTSPPTPHQIAILFTTFTSLGPIARTCLQTISMRNVSAYNDSLDSYLAKVDLEIDTFIA